MLGVGGIDGEQGQGVVARVGDKEVLHVANVSKAAKRVQIVSRTFSDTSTES